ncbi:LcrR family type III secretion system chaperone [Photorhabdus heterorhabditis]|uniref:LcrR family type III secretion system chaperone n=1 Tax=Photorhabdus heterorhabditis TaxID=880156 RepID=UPI001562AE31|nr:LcrR family type III secretion system chaperone [Photorhabdus heterorhabditis]NRN30051.1 LcrR family type III secretion system chaperone [Photorhabdus heterorhabditis subsp. aluminescens]
MNHDPLTPWFEAHGYSVLPHCMGNSSIPLGWRVRCEGCEIAWRYDAPRVWIIMLRRTRQRQGLANPFAPLYLLAKVTMEMLGPGSWLYGQVNTLVDSPLNDECLARFYHRWAGAREVTPGWFELAVSCVISLPQMRKQQKKVQL